VEAPTARLEPARRAALASGYVGVFAFLAVAVTVSILLGRGEHAPPAIAGFYGSTSPCLRPTFTVEQSGQFVDLGAGVRGKLRLRNRRLTGSVACRHGAALPAELDVIGSGKSARLAGAIGATQVAAHFSAPLPKPGVSAAKLPKRSSEETFGRLMFAIAMVILVARLVGGVTGRLGQPQVMGEVLAGILLGPSLLGAAWPEAKDYLFPADIVPLLSGAAQIGLAFYLFLVGMELDPRLLRERIGQAAFISNTSVAFPLALGFLVALPIYKLLSPDVRYLPFALFMGVAMSITAFPVLARILIERRMLKGPVGALAMAGAAIDDVTAWSLLALATAVAGTGSGAHVFAVVSLAALFTAGMILIGRPLLGRVSRAYDEAGHVPALWIGIIFVGVLLSAFVSQRIGIAAIFGAFVMGLIMPRHAGLTGDVSRRVEDFVVTVLLPLFFVVTGLKTHIGALNRPVLWLLTLALIGVAVAGKWFGAMSAAKIGGFGFRDAAAIGALMNTRGLTELIVLNIGLDLGVVSPALFTMLVVMALVTTFMAGPALRVLDPRGELSAPPEEDLRRAPRVTEDEIAVPVPTRSILVAPQDERNLDSLLALAEPLARATPLRELIIAQVVVPARSATGAIFDTDELTRITADLAARREEFISEQVASRTVVFNSVAPGKDYVRLASEAEIDLVIMDGRRPLLGEGVPRGPVGEVLDNAPCDVAVLVERQGVPLIDAEHPVTVPFGGAEHDWAALELGAWIASAYGAPLRLLGAGSGADGGDATRLLSQAALVVQSLAGVPSEPVFIDRAGGGLMRAIEGAGLVVVGLSERWRKEGLGPVRSGIAKAALSPILFTRRGTRPGALAPRGSDFTRFSWSRAG
jgi:Kef-type K+ transport system membrane component KefB